MIELQHNGKMKIWKSCRYLYELKECVVIAVVPCEVCRIIFFDPDNITEHKVICPDYNDETNSIYYIVPEAQRLIDNFQELQDLIYLYHEGTQHLCLLCSYETMLFSSFHEHMQKHERVDGCPWIDEPRDSTLLYPGPHHLPSSLKDSITYSNMEHIDPKFPSYCSFCNALLRGAYEKKHHSCISKPKICTYCSDFIEDHESLSKHGQTCSTWKI